MPNIINADNGVVSTIPGLKYSADTSGVLVLQTNTTDALTLDTTQGATFSTGVLVTNPYAGSYSSGMVLDHTTSLGRISVAASSGIAFYNGGISARVETMRISSTGNVGIGTASPSTRLVINGGTGTSQTRFEVNTTEVQEVATNAAQNAYANRLADAAQHIWKLSSSEAMRLNSSGNVGIGTSSPGYRLDVQAGSAAVNIQSTTSSNITYINFRNVGFNYVGIESSTGGSLFTGTAPYSAVFGTVSGYPVAFATSGVERMRITSGGGLLVNTTTQTGSTRMVVADSSGTGQIRAIHSTGSGFLINQDSAAGNVSLNNQDNAALLFNTNNSERMRISSNGNVSIGTTSSSWPLTVSSAGDTVIFLTSTGTNASGQFVANGNGAGSFPGYNLYQSGTNYWSMQMRGDTNLYLTRQAGSGNIIIPTGSIMNAANRPILNQSGSILQVVSTNLNTVVSTSIANNSTFYNISGFSVSITPSSTSSRILVMVEGVGSSTGYSILFALQLLRNGTSVGASAAVGGFRSSAVGTQRASLDGNSANNFSWHYVDSPATTSAITYQIAVTNESATTFNLNTTGNNNSGQIYSALSASNITVMEIAG